MSIAITPGYVVERLEEAGATLMALPSNAPMLGQRVQTYGYVAELAEGALPTRAMMLPVPDAAAITRMDEAYSWLSVIQNVAHRRIVAARSLRKPLSGGYVYSWHKLSKILGCRPEALPGWYAAAIDTMVRNLVFMAASGPIGKYER